MKATKIIVFACAVHAALAGAAAPEPYSFLHDYKLDWDPRRPASWVELDGAKVLKLNGAEKDDNVGWVGCKSPEAFERFRGMEVDFVLEYKLEGIKLRPSKWEKGKMETFKPVTWHWEREAAEWSSWVSPSVNVPESGCTIRITLVDDAAENEMYSARHGTPGPVQISVTLRSETSGPKKWRLYVDGNLKEEHEITIL